MPDPFSPTFIDGQLIQLNNGPKATTITNFDTSNNIDTNTDVGTDDLGNGAKFYTIINASEGSATRVMPKSDVGDTRQRGGAIIQKAVKLNVENDSGTAIEDVKVFIRDTDNGYRKNAGGQDHTADKIYFETTNASGETDEFNVTTAITNINNEPAGWAYSDWDTTNFSNAYKVDRRGKTDVSGEDKFDIHFWHYNYLHGQTEQELKGLEVKEINWTLFEDTYLTESSSSNVSAYTTIDNLDELYDYAKYWKTLNADNIQVPSVGDLLISISGKKLDLGAFDLVVDSGAGSVFAVDTGNNTITIKSTTLLSSSKFDYIETSGTITTANGATLEHGYIDSTGTNKFVHLDWNTPTSHNVIIENLQNNSNIVGPILATESYKGHFLMPNPVPTNGVRLTIETTNIGFSLFEELIPEADISFIRTNINLNANEERQVQMLYLMRKIFQKAEAINGALSGTTPNTNVSINFTSSSAEATNENQAAILELLRLVLVKISANRAAFEE